MDIKELPEIEKLYFEAIKKATEIKLKKIHDYNNGCVIREDYYLLGDWSLINELWKKMLRLISLYSSDNEPHCEAIEDTMLDLINYSADFYSYYMLNQRSEMMTKDKKNGGAKE